VEALKLAAVGLGYWGPNLARNLDELDGAELAWICDRDEARLIGATRLEHQTLARVAGPKAFRHLLSERGLKGHAGQFIVPRRIPVPDNPKSPPPDKPAAAAAEPGSTASTRAVMVWLPCVM